MDQEPKQQEIIQPKSNKGLKIAVVLLSIVAILGVGFGIFEFINNNTKTAENAKLTAKINLLEEETGAQLIETNKDGQAITVVEGGKIDKTIATNLVNPYLKDIYTFQNLLDSESLGEDVEDMKVEIAYLNLDVRDIADQDGYEKNIDYETLNKVYKGLFGSDKDLEKRDFTSSADKLYYSNSRNSFTLIPVDGLGGGGVVPITSVKQAYFDGDDIVVEVYRKNINVGDIIEVDEELISKDNFYSSTTATTLIEKLSDEIPIYKMIFAKDDKANSKWYDNNLTGSYYVLKDFQKISKQHNSNY